MEIDFSKKISLTCWRNDFNSSRNYKESLILFLTNGKPYEVIGANQNFDCTNDISIYLHFPRWIDFNGEVLCVDSSLLIGEYEKRRANIFAGSFYKGRYLTGIDFRVREFLGLDEIKQKIPAYLGISREEFLKLFQLEGMTETCRQGIREFLE